MIPALSLTLALAVASAASVLAAPAAPRHDSESGHRLEYLHRRSLDLSLPHFYPESVYEVVSQPAPAAPARGRSSFAPSSEAASVQVGVQFLADKLGIAASDFAIDNKYTDAVGVTHIFGTQLIDGIRVANHNAGVHVKAGRVVAYSSSFGAPGQIAKRDLTVAPPRVRVAVGVAVANARAQVGRDLALNPDFAPVLEYVQLPAGNVVYAHTFELKDEFATKWVQVSVDASTGQLVNVVDYVNSASYRAIQLPKLDPTEGFDLIANPEYIPSSPLGWTDDGTTKYRVTKGNNVVTSFAGTMAANSDVFETAWDAKLAPDAPVNKAASAVNLFYMVNIAHDIAYQYGFTEAAGNFQKNNFGKPGAGGDPVVVNVLASGTNNANFASPGDGQSGTMNMFRFTPYTPNRDSGFESVIPLHEFMHGVSNRMTGAARSGNCLSTSIAKGLGEGWSDYFGLFATTRASHTRFTPRFVGSYVESARGFRAFPYSGNMTLSPLTYSGLRSRTEVHQVGEVWNNMLWEMYWDLIDKYGFSASLYDAKQTAGNIVSTQLVFAGLTLQGCNPSFVVARNAIITADSTFYGGKYKCDIWRAFARRGLGANAVSVGTNTRNTKDDFSVPAECA